MATRKKTAPKEAIQTQESGVLTRVVDGVETVLTVNGEPIPAHIAHLIPYEKTDQGMAEVNEGKDTAYVQVVRDEWDNMLAARADAGTPIWASPDPMREAVEKHGRPGFANRFLSPKHIEKKGTRHYDIVRDGKGDPVKVGNMVLGEMPRDMRDARNKHYQNIGNADLAAVEAAYRTDQEKALRDAGISQDMASVLRSGEQLRDYDNPDREANIGFRSQRGEP